MASDANAMKGFKKQQSVEQESWLQSTSSSWVLQISQDNIITCDVSKSDKGQTSFHTKEDLEW